MILPFLLLLFSSASVGEIAAALASVLAAGIVAWSEIRREGIKEGFRERLALIEYRLTALEKANEAPSHAENEE